MKNKDILFKIKELIHNKDERTKLQIAKLLVLLESIPELEKFLNEDIKENNLKMLFDLSKFIKYKKFSKGYKIQNIYCDDKHFYMSLSGIIGKVSIVYKRITVSFKEYIIHLTKLFLLKEINLFNDCIEKNKDIFPFPSDTNLIKLFHNIKEFDYKREYINLLKYIKKSKWNNKPENIQEFLSLYNPKINISKHIYLSKAEKFSLLLPYFFYNGKLGENSFIGDLNKPKGIKNINAYICLNNVEVIYLDKSILGLGCNLFKLYNRKFSQLVLEKILKKHFIFKNVDVNFVSKYYSTYFKIIHLKKGEFLIHQNRPYEGIYFITEGLFQLKTFRTYNELDELIYNLEDCLYYFKNIISNLKFRDSRFISETKSDMEINIEKYNHVLKDELFISKSNEKKDIIFALYQEPQILGLNELYNNKNFIYNFSLNCLSEKGEVFFLPNEIVTSLLSIDSINNKIYSIVDAESKKMIYGIRKYKYFFVREIERAIEIKKQEEKMKRKNTSKSVIYSKNKMINDSFNILKNNIDSTKNNNFNSKPFIKKRKIRIKKILFNNENSNGFTSTSKISLEEKRNILNKNKIIIDLKNKSNSSYGENSKINKSNSCPNFFKITKINFKIKNKNKKNNKLLSSSTIFSNNNENILKRMKEILISNKELEDKSKSNNLNILKLNDGNKPPFYYDYKNLPENNSKRSFVQNIIGNLKTSKADKSIKSKHYNDP